MAKIVEISVPNVLWNGNWRWNHLVVSGHRLQSRPESVRAIYSMNENVNGKLEHRVHGELEVNTKLVPPPYHTPGVVIASSVYCDVVASVMTRVWILCCDGIFVYGVSWDWICDHAKRKKMRWICRYDHCGVVVAFSTLYESQMIHYSVLRLWIVCDVSWVARRLDLVNLRCPPGCRHV